MNEKRNTLYTTVALCLFATFASACAEASEEQDFRTLPVAAVTEDGDEILVGTYDEALGELSLLPGFVEAMEAEVESLELELELELDEERSPLALHTTWDIALERGDELELGAEVDGRYVATGSLVIHAPAWTDGLSELDAASSFPACWDPPEECTIFDFCSPTQQP